MEGLPPGATLETHRMAFEKIASPRLSVEIALQPVHPVIVDRLPDVIWICWSVLLMRLIFQINGAMPTNNILVVAIKNSKIIAILQDIELIIRDLFGIRVFDGPQHPFRAGLPVGFANPIDDQHRRTTSPPFKSSPLRQL